MVRLLTPGPLLQVEVQKSRARGCPIRHIVALLCPLLVQLIQALLLTGSGLQTGDSKELWHVELGPEFLPILQKIFTQVQVIA